MSSRRMDSKLRCDVTFLRHTNSKRKQMTRHVVHITGSYNPDFYRKWEINFPPPHGRSLQIPREGLGGRSLSKGFK